MLKEETVFNVSLQSLKSERIRKYDTSGNYDKHQWKRVIYF